MVKNPRSLTEIFEQIRKSVRTIRLLPPVRVRDKFCNWPDFVRSFHESYGYNAPTIRIIPTARQIKELDEVIDWLACIGGDTAKIIWARAENYSWRRISYMVGMSDKTCKERFRIGIVKISHNLQKPRGQKKHFANSAEFVIF